MSKTITIKPRTPLDIGHGVRILYGVRTGPDAVQDRAFEFARDEDGRQMPCGFTPESSFLTYRIERTLDTGDSIYFVADNGPLLRERMIEKGHNPDAVTIGAFWEVCEYGSLVCTGT